jgi:hypothetical protein
VFVASCITRAWSVGQELFMSDYRPLRVAALVAPARRRSVALVLGAAAVALSLGASVALQWIESPPAQGTASVALDVVPPQMRTMVAPVEQGSPKDHAGPPTASESPPSRQSDRPTDLVTQPESRPAATLDLDVVPPAMTPAAAEAPKRADSSSATVATLAGAAGGAAVAAVGPKRTVGAPSQAIPLPRPAPPAETRAAAAGTPGAVKDQGRRRGVGSYPKRGPLKLIGMLFGGWRN